MTTTTEHASQVATPQASEDSSNEHPLVLFDGVCGMCNTFVDFIMKYDRTGKFRFAPLQGTTALKYVSEQDCRGLKSVIYIYDNQIYRRSSAIVRILWEMGSFWTLLGWALWIIPKPLRDLGYRLVAKVRYRIFGKKDACRMPTPEERARFLD